MSYGLSQGIKTKLFGDYVDGGADDRLNQFLEDNPNIEVLDIKFQYHPNPQEYQYGAELLLLVYREFSSYDGLDICSPVPNRVSDDIILLSNCALAPCLNQQLETSD